MKTQLSTSPSTQISVRIWPRVPVAQASDPVARVILTGEGGDAAAPAPETHSYIQRPEIFANATPAAGSAELLTQSPDSAAQKKAGCPESQAAPSAAHPSPHGGHTPSTHPARTPGITHNTPMQRHYLLITKGSTSLLEDLTRFLSERGHEIEHASEKTGDDTQIAIGTPIDRQTFEAGLPSAQDNTQAQQSLILQKLESIEQQSCGILEIVSKKEGRGD